tara:strand:+ start:145 stop:543 length:399 start_codon:yes stop_codon:yes gene_type:complete
VGESRFCITNLPFRLRLAPELLEHLNHLPRSGGAERVSFGLETAAGIDGRLTFIQASFSVSSEQATFTSGGKPKIFRCKNLSDGETVVNLGHVDVLRAEAGHAVGFGGGHLGGPELGDTRAVMKRQMIRGGA